MSTRDRTCASRAHFLPEPGPWGLSPERASERGIALIAVLVVLALLLALMPPFLLSMNNQNNATVIVRDKSQSQLSVDSGVEGLLHRAAMSHESVDESPGADGLAEMSIRLDLPAEFGRLHDGRTRLLTGEAEDEQRRANLKTATPLLIGNLLSLATFTSAKVAADSVTIPCGDLSGFDDHGFVVVDGELIEYGGKEGSTLTQCKRGLLVAPDSAYGEPHDIADNVLVLDVRCRLAVTYPFDEGGNDRRAHAPWRSLEDLARIGTLGFGPFTALMIEKLRPHLTVHSALVASGEWMKGERIYTTLEAGLTREILLESGSFVGPGSVVRIRAEGRQEFALIRKCEPTGSRDKEVVLPSTWLVTLERPVVHSCPEDTAILEVLAPHPVNVNTASEKLLTALLTGIQSRMSIDRETNQPRTSTPVSRTQAATWAARLVEARSAADESGRPFPLSGWEDVLRRWIDPMVADGAVREEELFPLYRAVMHSRDAGLTMGTAPLCFTSEGVFRFRSAASIQSGIGIERARGEVQGFAHAFPGGEMLKILGGQAQIDEELRYTRQSPFWITYPNNTGAVVTTSGGERSTNPSNRIYAHLMPRLFDPPLPARFPSQEPTESYLQLQPAISPPTAQNSEYYTFWGAPNAEGRELTKEGAFEIKDSAAALGQSGGQQPGRPRGHGATMDQTGSFPLSLPGGERLAAPVAFSFWWRPTDLSDQTIFDLTDTDSYANRMLLELKAGKLRYLVYDNAGQDTGYVVPDFPTAGVFEVPLADARIEPDTWAHVSFSADGNRPDQVVLLIDNVMRGKALYRTFLTQPLDEFKPGGNRSTDKDTFPVLEVESTEGFPDAGVVRIGEELFEYSAKGPTSFDCKRADSMGRRAARMSLTEFNRARAINQDKSFDEEQLGALDVAPAHPAGSAVELYGYSGLFLAGSQVPVGEATLGTEIGPFGVAKVINGTKVIQIPGAGGGGGRPVGKGLDETQTGPLELAAPTVGSQTGKGDVMASFSKTGGYAFLVQRSLRARDPTSGETVDMGGVELIQYSGYSGTKLDVTARGVQLDRDVQEASTNDAFYSGSAKRFVTEWLPNIFGQIKTEEYPQTFTFCVPVSLPVTGTLPDPKTSGYAEWAQIYPGKDREVDTEWFRYDVLAQGHALRLRREAAMALNGALTDQLAQQNEIADIGTPPSWLAAPIVYEQPVARPDPEIGNPDEYEFGQNLPHFAARKALRFRGDVYTNTSAHRQTAGSAVHPVIRSDISVGIGAAFSARPGRNDRVALAPAATSGGNAAASQAEWHTVSWSRQRYVGDQAPAQGGQTGRAPVSKDLAGPACQLVAFKEGVIAPFIGRPADVLAKESRRFDRMLKFPSGELPAVTGQSAYLGGGKSKDARPAGGMLDEVNLFARQYLLTQAFAAPGNYVLEEPLAEGAGEMKVTSNMFRSALGPLIQGPIGGGVLPTTMKQSGGLLLVDAELIAYREVRSDGTTVIAQDGRGLLGTIPRAHDAGASVLFLDQVPTTTLANALSSESAIGLVNSMRDFPRAEGTVLIGQELLHYTWTRANPDGGAEAFEMPERKDPSATANPDQTSVKKSGSGLFRGRYGTAAASHGAGTPVISFPFRYWDRWTDRADDPELAHFTMTVSGPDLWFTGMWWEEEVPDSTIDFSALVRIDGISPWSAQPAVAAGGQGAASGGTHAGAQSGGATTSDATKPATGLFRFDAGSVDGKPNPLGFQGSLAEVRFFASYKSGAFDPVTFLASGWKRTPRLKAAALSYHGRSRVISQRTTAR